MVPKGPAHIHLCHSLAWLAALGSLSLLSSSFLVGISDHPLKHYHFLPQPLIILFIFYFTTYLVLAAYVPLGILPVFCLLLEGSDSDPFGFCLCPCHLERCVCVAQSRPSADFC